MSENGNKAHICEEHLGVWCRCTVCGEYKHDYESNDDGSFAASGKVVTARCKRCGSEEHYYADTGTVIENYRDRSYDLESEPVIPPKPAPQGEMLFILKKLDDEYIITGITKRSVAEKMGLRHLTVIVVPFVTDGPDKGCWIIHNRHDKQIAKGKTSAPLSLNLFGGHCGPSNDDTIGAIGLKVGLDMLREHALRELSEELLYKNGLEKRLEVWRDGVFTGEYISASQYRVHPELFPIGFTEYTAKDNVEYSYIFALPVPGVHAEQIIAADNYEKSTSTGTKTYEADIALPILFMQESELKRLWRSRIPQVEVCDAITRLWEEQNEAVYQKLIEYISNYKD